MGAWKEKDDGRYHDRDTLLAHHHRAHEKEKERDGSSAGKGNGKGKGEEKGDHGGIHGHYEQTDPSHPPPAFLQPQGEVEEVSYLDNEGYTVHYHDSLELEKHQYTVPYRNPSPLSSLVYRTAQ